MRILYSSSLLCYKYTHKRSGTDGSVYEEAEGGEGVEREGGGDRGEGEGGWGG